MADELELVRRAVEIYNERARTANGIDDPSFSGHAYSSDLAWGATTLGLDIDNDALVALGTVLADQMGESARSDPEYKTLILRDGLRQMFVIGALHEQERLKRELKAKPTCECKHDPACPYVNGEFY